MTCNFWKVLACLLSTSVFGISRPQTDSAAQACAVHILVVTEFGYVLPYKVLSFVSGSAERDWAGQFKGLRIASIPCGDYNYTLDRTDIRAATAQLKGRIHLADPEQWLTVVTSGIVVSAGGTELSLDGSGPRRRTILGTVAPLPAGGERAWVKLQSLFESYSTSAPIDAAGQFRVYGVVPGRYLLIVLRGGREVAVVPLTVQASGEPGRVHVHLPARLPDTIDVR